MQSPSCVDELAGFGHKLAVIRVALASSINNFGAEALSFREVYYRMMMKIIELIIIKNSIKSQASSSHLRLIDVATCRSVL